MSSRTSAVCACRSDKGFSRGLFGGYQDQHAPHEDRKVQQLKQGDNKSEDNCLHVNSVNNDKLIPDIQTDFK